MTLPAQIAAIQKNASEEIRVCLQHFKGHDLCDIRVFGMFTTGKVFMPTGKGVAVNVMLLPDLIHALQEAERKAREMGLLAKSEGKT